MNTFKKRMLSGILSVAMLFSTCGNLLPHAAAASNNAQQIEATGGSKTEHEVTISKTITPTDDENYFDITLTATDTQRIDENSVDVVLVMDISNTMNRNNRLVNAKAAAWAFVQAFGGSQNLSFNRRVGLVTFNSDANIVMDLQYPNRAMEGTIGSITAPNNSRRFTNIEGGLLLAKKMLDPKVSQAEHKFVILLTDGFPTTYTETTGQRTMTGYDTESGCFYDYEKGATCWGTDYSDKSAIAAQNAATTLKDDNINVISIGVNIGGQTIQGYIDAFASSTTVSTVERAKGVHPNYVIGNATDKEGYANWLETRIGGGPLMKGNLSAYYSGDDAEKLSVAFNDILSTIEMTTTHAMVNPKFAADPMGSHIQFLGFYNKNGALDPDHKLAGTRAQGSENTASYDSKINWDLSQSGYTINQVDEATIQYIYKLKYRVRLENELQNFKEHTDYNTNGKTTLTFDSTDGKEYTIEYPMPEVEGYLGEFSFTKTNNLTGENQKPLGGAQFKLSHSSASCSVCKSAGENVTIPDQNVTSSADGKVAFTRIPSGHDYTLTETKPPLGYAKDTGSYLVGVHYDTVTVNGAAVMDTVANKPLDPIQVSFRGSKTLDGEAPAANAFSFELRDWEDKVLKTVKNSADGSFVFDDITLSSVGTYVYKITEVNPQDSDIIYDRSVYYVTVNVEVDNEKNPTKLVPTITYHNHSTDQSAQSALFNNTSRQSAVIHPVAHKTLTGNRPLKDQEFTFELLSSDQETVLQTKTNNTSGEVAFSGISLNDEGTFTYYIREKIPTGSDKDAHIVYDETLWKLTAVVTADPNNPVYNASVTYTNLSDNTGADKASFTNALEELPNDNVTFSFTKTLLDGTKLQGVRFQLRHNPSCCSEMSNAPYEAKDRDSNADGVVTFENIPSGHYYILEEISSTVGDQYLKAENRDVAILYGKAYIDGALVENAGSVVIKNVPTDHARVILSAWKNMDGSAALGYDGQFTFNLYQKGNSTPVDTQSNLSTHTGSGVISQVIFNPIYFEYDGIYYYEIKESRGSNDTIVYDDTTRYITIVVEGTKDKACTCTDAKCTAAAKNDNCEACKLGHTNCTYEPPVCVCTTHCTTAPEESVCKVCHSDPSKCAKPAPVCNCTDKCTEEAKKADCPVCSGSQGISGCTGTVPTPTCNCTDKCTEEAKKADCPVCSGTQGIAGCTGTAPTPAPSCDCTVKCTEEAKKADCPVCSGDITKCTVPATDPQPTPAPNAPAPSAPTDAAEPTGDGSSSSGSTGANKPKVTIYVSTKGYYTPDGGALPEGCTVYNPNGSSIVFQNKTRLPASATLTATKAMSGNDTLGTFQFQLLDADGHVLQTKENSGSNVTFDAMSYNAVGSHTYYIVEVPGTDPNMTYDTTRHKVTVDVTAPAGAESYAAKVTYSSGKAPVFFNKTLTTLALSKVDENGNPMPGAEFTLKHTGCCEESINSITAISQDDGKVILTGITSGHTYILEETKPRDGYVPAPDHKIVVKDGSISIFDKESDGSWTPVPQAEESLHQIANYPKASVTLTGNKSMVGMQLKGNDYSFELLAADKQTVLQTVKNDASGHFTFEALEYDHQSQGSHVYYIREKLPAQADRNPGITYDTTLYKVTIDVTVSKDNQVTATRTIAVESADGTTQSAEGIVFTNIYTINGEVIVNLAGKKLLDDGIYNRPLKMNEFHFSIYLADSSYNIISEPIRTLSNGTRNDPNAPQDPTIIEFAPHVYNTQGDHYLVILEHETGLGGITYDTSRYHMHVKVEDNGIGGLKATLTLKNSRTGETRTIQSSEPTTGADGKQTAIVDAVASESNITFQFKNSYAPTGPALFQVEGYKNLTIEDGDMALSAGDYKFAMFETDSTFTVPENAVPLETVKNDSRGAFVFSKLRFDSIDLEDPEANKYYYVIKEVNTGIAGVTYDDTVYCLALEVYDDLAGNLAVKSDLKTPAQLQDTEVTPEPVDPGDSGLIPAQAIVFNNSFSEEGLAKVTFSGKKTMAKDSDWTLAAGDFTFRLYQTDAWVQKYSDFKPSASRVLEETTHNSKGNYNFQTIYYGEYQTGPHYYVIQEVKGDELGMTYDETLYSVKVNVYRDSATGKLESGVTVSKLAKGSDTAASATVTGLNFVNRYTSPDITVPITAIKTVKNTSTGTAKPEGFEFQLVDEDGNKKTAKSDSKGKAVFNLTFGEEDIGKTYTYTLTEINTKKKNFTYSKASYEFEISISLNEEGKIEADIKKDGKAVTTASGAFENIYSGKKDYIPKTGDDSNITFYFTTMGASFALLAAVYFLYLKTRPKYKPKFIR